MTKFEFLGDLSRLIADLPEEDREQAMEYYEDYFTDAGPDKEQEVIKEFISPAYIAEQLREASAQRLAEQGNAAFVPPKTTEKPAVFSRKSAAQAVQAQQIANSANATPVTPVPPVTAQPGATPVAPVPPVTAQPSATPVAPVPPVATQPGATPVAPVPPVTAQPGATPVAPVPPVTVQPGATPVAPVPPVTAQPATPVAPVPPVTAQPATPVAPATSEKQETTPDSKVSASEPEQSPSDKEKQAYESLAMRNPIFQQRTAESTKKEEELLALKQKTKVDIKSINKNTSHLSKEDKKAAKQRAAEEKAHNATLYSGSKRTVLMIVLLIASPIILAILGLILGLFLVAIGLVVGLVALGIAAMLSSIAFLFLTILAITSVNIPNAVLALGCALLLFSAGYGICFADYKIFTRVLPSTYYSVIAQFNSIKAKLNRLTLK